MAHQPEIYDPSESDCDVGLAYHPKSAETREVYEMIVSCVRSVLGDDPNDIALPAADCAIEVLKCELINDSFKRKEIEGFLGPISDDIFSHLLSLTEKITDYGPDEDDAALMSDSQLVVKK